MKVRAKFRPCPIADIVEEHFEEVQVLWNIRRRALSSPDQFDESIRRFEERFEAHVDALLVAGERALLPLAKKAVAGEDLLPAFAAAFILLRTGSDRAMRTALEALAHAKKGALDGVREAFIHAAPPAAIASVRQVAQGALPAAAAIAGGDAPAPAAANMLAALAILVARNPAEPAGDAVNAQLSSPDPVLRAQAWDLAASMPMPRGLAVHQAALADVQPAVRAAAIRTAAWTSQTWLLEHLRKSAAKPAPAMMEELALFASLATPADLPLIAALGRNEALGPGRFEILAAFGHPGVVELLLKAMESPIEEIAAAAADAYSKLTGQDAANLKSKRTPVAPAGADAFEKKFAQEKKVPDPKLARAHWEQSKARFSQGTRWARGLNADKGADFAALAHICMQSWHRAKVRARFLGQWRGAPFDLQRLPFRP